MYAELMSRISKLLDSQDVVTVAVSGHGGSGKSTLAEKLAHDFGIKAEQIIHVDELYALDYLKAKDIFDQHEWRRLATLLTDARSSSRLAYLSRDWQGNERTVRIERPRIIIVEGIRLIQPDLLSYFDVSIWIDCPLEFATKRAIERNRQQGDSEAEIELWHTKWVPEAEQYYERSQPQKIANFIYSEYDSIL